MVFQSASAADDPAGLLGYHSSSEGLNMRKTVRDRLSSARVHLSNISSQSHPGRFVVSRVMVRIGVTLPLLRLHRQGYALRFYPTSLTWALWSNPREGNDEAFLRRYLRPSDIVVDVGANVGHLSLLAASLVGEAGWVVAIEAHPRIFACLSGNVELNKCTNIAAHSLALGDSSGVTVITDLMDDNFNWVGSSSQGVTVPLEPLDSVRLPDGEIALIKIDVEGYEKHVLAGARRTLERTACVYLEVWDEAAERFGYSIHDVISVLQDLDFAILHVSGDTITYVQHSFCAPDARNIVAVRDLDAFRERTGFRLPI